MYWEVEKLRNEENYLKCPSDATNVIKARGSTEEEDRKCIQYLVRTLLSEEPTWAI